MKKKCIVLFLSGIMCLSSGSHIVLASDVTPTPELSEEDSSQISIDGFRGYAWGTSLADIVNAELTSSMVSGVDYTLSDNVLFILDGEVSNYKTNVGYFFDSALKLEKAAYLLDEEHIDYYNYYQDYCNLEELYETKYALRQNRKLSGLMTCIKKIKKTGEQLLRQDM
jgi:hypothetical protein